MDQLNYVLIFVCGMAAVFDLFTKKIPNWLNISAIVGGLLLQYYLGSLQSLMAGSLAMLIGFSIYIPLYYFKVMGAGDVKLMMSIGALSNVAFVIRVALCAIFLGGIYALLDTALRGRLRNLINFLLGFLNGIFSKEEMVTAIDKTRKFSFGIAIFLATILVFYMERKGFFI